jgi:hypothetical protein
MGLPPHTYAYRTYNPKKVTGSKPDGLRSARNGDVTDYIRVGMKQTPKFARATLPITRACVAMAR